MYTEPTDRRLQGFVRVPCIRRCRYEIEEGGAAHPGFLVNLNVLGAYISPGDPFVVQSAIPPIPRLNQDVTCRFTLPGNEVERVGCGRVVWLNLRQQHPVHSLPAGFGVQFYSLEPGDRLAIDAFVAEYLATHPPPR